MRGTAAAAVILGGLAAGLAGTLLFGRRSAEPAAGRTGPSRGLLLAAAWMLLVAALIRYNGLQQPWYLLNPVMAFALTAGLAYGSLGALLEPPAPRGRVARAGRVSAWVALASLTALLLWHASYAPPLRRPGGAYAELDRADARLREFLTNLERRILEAPRTGTLQTRRMPIKEPPADSGPAVHGAAILHDYSVQAWAELRFPGRPFQTVIFGADRDPRAERDFLTLVLPLADYGHLIRNR